LVPAAMVVARAGSRVTSDDLKNYCLAKGAAYSHPRFIDIVAALPLNGAGKIDRRAAATKLEAAYGAKGDVGNSIGIRARLAIGTMGETMLSEADRKKAADILMGAEKERKQAIQLSKTWPDIGIEDAYAISREVAKRKIAAGAKLIGHKVGLTSKAMQRS